MVRVVRDRAISRITAVRSNTWTWDNTAPLTLGSGGNGEDKLDGECC